MGVTVTLIDIYHRTPDLMMGPYDSIQLTYNLLRDDHDNTIAEYEPELGAWLVPFLVSHFTDITIGQAVS